LRTKLLEETELCPQTHLDTVTHLMKSVPRLLVSIETIHLGEETAREQAAKRCAAFAHRAVVSTLETV